MQKPNKLVKGKSFYTLNKYGSYVDDSEYGMAAQKNAMSYKELIELGYKPINKIKQ